MRKLLSLRAQRKLAVLPLVIALMFLVCGTTWAENDANSLATISMVTKPLRGSEEAHTVIQTKGKLTLDAYLRAVDSYFPGLLSAQDQRQIASAVRLEKQGLFDPLLTNESGYTRMQNTSKIGEPKEVLFNYPKLELPFRSGVRTFFQFRYNPNSSQSPYIETGEGGEYSSGIFVPLLRGLIYNEQSVAEKEAKLGEQLAGQTYFLTRLDTLLKAGTIYWTWVGAKQKADVAHEILNLANIVIDISRQQEQAGDLARIYVVEAEEDVHRREADLTQSRRDFQRVSFRLSALLFDMGGIPLPLPTEVNVPDNIPVPRPYTDADSEHNILIALAARPELKAIGVEKRIATVELKLAKNQLLPALNAVATYGRDTGFHGIGNAWRAQLTFSEPLYLRTARGKLQAAKLRLSKLENDRKAEEQRIRNEVLDATSAINLAYEKFAALKLQVDNAQQVYEGERERFNVGDSTVFLIAERERQLNEAKVRMIDAAVEYHVGVLALRAITGQF